MNILREKCVETKEEIKVAAHNRAGRIELCSRLDVGGLTPAVELADFAVKRGLSVAVMIRNRRDFLITQPELMTLSAEMYAFLDTGVSGFVFGFLTSENTLDISALQILLSKAGGKETVFHMAFDEISQQKQFAALNTIAALGFRRILTKGGHGSAADNITHLKALAEYASGKIELIVGGKITDSNYMEICEKTGITQCHGRKLAGE